MKKTITFLLPGSGLKPIGGFRVVYEYANQLVLMGYVVTILHISWMYKSRPLFPGLLRYLGMKQTFFSKRSWFVFDKRVKKIYPLICSNLTTPSADFIVATSWETAEYLNGLDKDKGSKLYLIQGNEAEFPDVVRLGLQKRVLNTYYQNFHKIVVGSWLKELVSSLGVQSQLILNGLNHDEFSVDNSIEERNPFSVLLLYHKSRSKGSFDVIEALKIVKAEIPQLKISLFGATNDPEIENLEYDFYSYPHRIFLRKLYNDNSIFISGSYSEGWGLTLAEAMQCGCAVISSDIPGVKDFVINKKTAITFGVGDIHGMADKTIELIRNQGYRIELAKKSVEFVKQFSWQIAASKLDFCLKEIHKS